MFCSNCGSENPDGSLRCSSCGAPLASASGSLAAPGPREKIPNNLVWAILVTLFCCLPFGIVAIVYAARVDGLVAAGNYEEARRSSHLAKVWSLASCLSVVAIAIIYLLLMLVVAVLGNMQ